MGGEILKLVTGNRLRDGKVIYFAGGGTWTPEIETARMVPEAEAEALLAEAQSGSPPHPAVGPMLIEVERENGKVVPLTLRERIRAEGPTVTAHGG